MENKEKELLNEKLAEDLVKAQLGEDVFEKVNPEDIVKIREEIDEDGQKMAYFKNKERGVRDEKIKNYYKEKLEIYKNKREELKKERDKMKEIIEIKEREAKLEKVIAPKENKFDLWNPKTNTRSVYDNPESALNSEIMPAIEKLENELNSSAMREMEIKIKDIYSYDLSEIKSGKQIEEWDFIQNCSAKAILEAASYRDSAFGPFVGEADHEEINNRIELQNYLRELAIKNKTAPEENESVKNFIFRIIKSTKNSSELNHWLEQKEKAGRLTINIHRL